MATASNALFMMLFAFLTVFTAVPTVSSTNFLSSATAFFTDVPNPATVLESAFTSSERDETDFFTSLLFEIALLSFSSVALSSVTSLIEEGLMF